MATATPSKRKLTSGLASNDGVAFIQDSSSRGVYEPAEKLNPASIDGLFTIGDSFGTSLWNDPGPGATLTRPGGSSASAVFDSCFKLALNSEHIKLKECDGHIHAVASDGYPWKYCSTPITITTPRKDKPIMSRRLIIRSIIDRDRRVPVGKALVYCDPVPVLSDLSDTDLWLEIPVLDLLAKHNATRILIEDLEESRKRGFKVTLPEILLDDLQRAVLVHLA
jgi:hypothetical protein